MFINQSIVIWTPKTKSLLPSLYSPRKRWRSGQKGGITPLWPPAHRASGPEGKEGRGEIFKRVCLLNYGLLSNSMMGIRIILIMFLLTFPLLLIGDERSFDKKIMISIENLKRVVENIHFDRNPYDGYPKLEQAEQYIERDFQKIGWEVKEDTFQWEGRTYKNIVAEKKGGTSPHRVFILGAHYDTVPGSPGADDNASAIAVLLEVARNIQTVHVKGSVRFIAA